MSDHFMLVKGHKFLAAILHGRIRYRACRECAGDHAHANWRQSPSTWALCIGYQAAEIRRISGASRLLSKARRAMRIAPSKGSLCGRTRNCFTRLGNQGAKGSARPPIRLIVEVPPATRRSIMRAAKPAVSCTSSTAKESWRDAYSNISGASSAYWAGVAFAAKETILAGSRR